MALLINSESGLAEDLPQDVADRALSSQTHEIPLNDPQGNPVTAPLSDMSMLLSQGYSQPSEEQRHSLMNHSKFSAPTEQIKTALEGAAEGVLPGAATAIEKHVFGVPEENILARREINPGVHTLGQMGGFGLSMATGVGAAEMLGSAGIKAAGALGLGAEGAGVLSRIGATSVKQAVEMIGLQAGDEVSKMVINDPNQTYETALINVGAAGALGGIIGGTLSGVGELWKAGVSSKVGKFIDDVKSGMDHHLQTPDPVKGMTEELTEKYNTIKNASSEVYGEHGLKSREIEKLMPEMTPKIMDQAKEVSSKANETLKMMESNPADYPESLVAKLRKRVGDFDSKISEEVDPLTLEKTKSITPSDVFNATQDLKQNLQEWGKFNKFMVPLAEKDFRSAAKALSYDLRTSLENPEVWGKVAERQQAINKAFSEYLPTLKDFEKKFTVEIAGEREIDPGKINTYLNQIGKPNAEIKQSMLDNFLKASDKYESAITDTHANLGLERPSFESKLGVTRSTLEEKTAGRKVADYLFKRGAGEVAGGAIGGTIGHSVGHGGLGALIGEHALSPFLNTVMPSMLKSLAESATNPGAFKSSIDYVLSAAKGENLLGKTVSNVFNTAKDVLPLSLIPSDKERTKLNKMIDDINNNPGKMYNAGNDVAHYMPNHTVAIAETSTRIASYLSQLKPREDKQKPLDANVPHSSIDKARYNNALNIAQQPLVALAKIRNGTLTKEDLTDLRSMYPSLYASMSRKLTKEIMDVSSKKETIPYKTRLSLSMFLGSPLDSTMTQSSIAAHQTQVQPQMPMQQGIKGSMKNISKMAMLDKTPAQSREMSQAMK